MGIIINGQNDTIGPVDNSMSLLGTVSIGGTMTIEDFTNIDSVGLITARSGLDVTGGTVNITTGTNSASPAASGDNLVIKDSNGCGLSILSGDGNSQNIYLGSTSDNDGVRLEGFYNSGNPYFNIYTGGSQRFLISSTGRIGIDNTTPHRQLVVGNGGDISCFGANGGIYFGTSTGGFRSNGAIARAQQAGYHVSGSQVGDLVMAPEADKDLIFSSGSTNTMYERLRLKTGGNIGINDSGPNFHLDVNGNIALREGQVLTWHDGSGNKAGDIYMDSSDNFVIRNTSSVTERLRITSAGLVGVNCTPLSQFHVKTGTNQNIALSSMSSEASIEAYNDAGSANVPLRLRGQDFKFYTSSTERLRIDSSGRILQGLTSAKLGFFNDSNAAPVHQIQGSNYYTTAFSIFRNGSGQSGPNFILAKGREAIVQDDDILGSISFQGHDGTTELIEGASIQARVNGTPGSNDMPGCLIFSTSSDGSSLPTERLRVTSAGRVGINNTKPQTALNVQGTISTGRNLAREVGTVISSSTNYNVPRQASNVLNGKKNYENGGNDWLTAGNNRDNANLVIDLGAQYSVDRVVIYNQNEYDHSKREVKRFNLEGSNDNSNWTLLIDDELGRSDAHEPNPGFSFRLPHVSSPGGMHDDNEGVSYRYWKFTMKDFHGTDPYGGIMEIELYQASDAVDSEVSTHSVVASDVYTQTLSAQRIAIGENGALGDFRANGNENVYINTAARFGQNTGSSSGNASRHTGWRMYGYNPAGINNRLQYTIDGLYMRKSFYFYFPNGSANQAIRFHSNRNSFWTGGYITIHSTYSHQNASGLLRYNFRYNRNGGANYGSSIDVETNIGNTSGNFGMSNSYSFKGWSNTTGGTDSNGNATYSHAIELRHLTSTGNGCWVTWELFGSTVGTYADDLYMTTGYTY